MHQHGGRTRADGDVPATSSDDRSMTDLPPPGPHGRVEVRIEDDGGGERWVPGEVVSWVDGPGGRRAEVRHLDGATGTFEQDEVRSTDER